MWDVKACRSCLTVKGKLERIGEAFKRTYTALTGLQISESDGFPNYFCMECRTQIRKALVFRRRSRRAHFVMKEIMTIRKKVTYSDIVTVNRKKTNLESSLDFWQPNNNACYVIIDESEPIDNTSEKAVTMFCPDINQHHSSNLVDIRPSQDLVPEEHSVQNADLETHSIDNQFMDVPNDYSNIDLDDVFKDLKDDDVNSDDETKKESAVSEEDVPKDILKAMISKYRVKTVIAALCRSKIRVLDDEEQEKRFEERKKKYPFHQSLYKCAMCVTVHKNMSELMAHVQYHNKRLGAHECKVCKNKFCTENELTIHTADWHLYEYECTECSLFFYTLYEAVKHTKLVHARAVRGGRARAQAAPERGWLAAHFTLTPLTQSMMRDALAFPTPASQKAHYCTKCNCAFTNRLMLERHLVLHEEQPATKRNYFKCDVCGVWMKHLPSLARHMEDHHLFLYTCNTCKEVFTKKWLASEHAAKQHGDTKLTCKDCNMKFTSQAAWSAHRQRAHYRRLRHAHCTRCGRGFPRLAALYKHQLAEHHHISINDPLLGDPAFKCKECETQFHDKRSFELHVVTLNHPGAEDVEFSCVPCKKIYENQEEMELHNIVCKYPKKYPRRCCYCEEMLHDGKQYKSHFFEKHPDLQYRYTGDNTICELCGKSVRKVNLEAHLKCHNEASLYECKHCPAVLATPETLVTHVLSNHARRPYLCALCLRRYKHKAECKDHILRVHAPTKLYKCEFCGEEFSYFRNLMEHSEKMHNYVIPPLKNKPMKSKSKVFLYAHMKVDASLIDREVLQKTHVVILDYLDQKFKPVDYNDYFIFDDDADDPIVEMKRKVKKRKTDEVNSDIIIKPDQDFYNAEVEIAIKRIKLDNGDDINYEVFGNDGSVTEKYDEDVLERYEETTENYEALEDFDDAEVDDGLHVNNGTESAGDLESLHNNHVMSEPNGEQTAEVDLENTVEYNVPTDELKFDDDPSEPLQVLEDETGVQFVMLNGELYRIAGNDED